MSLKRVVYLTDTEYATLKSTGSVEIPANSGNIYTPSAETEFRKIVETSKSYRHTMTFNATAQNQNTYVLNVVLVDNYSGAYDAPTLKLRYGHCTFVGHEDLSGPPGALAVIGNSLVSNGEHGSDYYAQIFTYGDDFDSMFAYATLTSDSVTEL